MNLLAGLQARFCSSRINPTWTHLVLILLVGITVYSNTFYVPFVLDDHYSIEFFGTLKFKDIIFHGSDRRVGDLTFALNDYLHGANLVGYHSTNLAIHLATAITLYFFVHSIIFSLRKSITDNQTTFMEQFMPFATALLFVCHPLQTQAVTYTIQRYTSLATLFYLLSVLAFTKARYAFEQERYQLKTWLWGSACIVAALLSFGSKQIAATIPLMLIVLEVMLFRGRLLNRRFFIACTALFMLIPATLLYEWQAGQLDDFLYDLRHATADNLFISRTVYFLTQTRVVVTYLRLLFLPINQNLFYDYPIYSSFFSLSVLASIALHSFLIIVAIVFFRLSRNNLSSINWSRGVSQRLAALGIVWFYIALTVESSLIPIRDVIFEHRVYLPSVGFFITITAILAGMIGTQQTGKRTLWALLAISCLTLSGMTIARNHIWGDSLTIWEDTAKKSPNKGIVLANLAAEYLDRNRPDKSLPLFVRAIEANPNLDFRAKTGVGASMKALKMNESRFTTGDEYILPGGTLNGGYLDYGSYSKWESVISNNMGLAFEYLNAPEKALHAYKTSVTMNPAYDLAWYNMALLTARWGFKAQTAEAINRLKILNPAMAKVLESTVPH